MTDHNLQNLRLPLEKFLQKFGQLPAVRQMVEEEIEHENAESIAARSASLAELRVLQKQEATAQAAKALSEATYQKKLAELEPLRVQMHQATLDHGTAQRQVSEVVRTLRFKHGEDLVIHALAVITSMHSTCLKTVTRLELVSGLEPDVKRGLDHEKLQLSHISEALDQVKKLAFADGVSPGQLKAKTAELMKAAGYKPASVNPDGRTA